MSYVFGAIDALANLFGYSIMAGIGVFVLAVIACNLIDFGRAAWAKIKREWAPTGWLDDL